jgi:hypothetical protein
MAPKQKPRWERRLKNGYIQRETNSAGHLVYVAQPLYSTDEYDSCTGAGCGRRYYRYYSWHSGNRAPHPWRPVERRRVNIPASFGYGCIQATDQPREATAETDERQPQPKHKVAVTSSKEGSRSHIQLRDDPIKDGCALAEDTNVFLPLGGPWPEDEEMADLAHEDPSDSCEGRGTDIRLSDVLHLEPAYTTRYTTRKSGKDRRKASVECWEDDLVIIEESWEEDWELV